jgi:protein-disulfide isomerase
MRDRHAACASCTGLPLRIIVVTAFALLGVSPAYAGADSERSTVTLEIRAWSLATPAPGDMVRGNDAAPVTVVAFTDYHSSTSNNVARMLQRLLVHYRDEVRIVHRDFPDIRLNPHAIRVHEAARCAAEQDGFWPYHDRIINGTPPSDADQFLSYAREAGLDGERLLRCLVSGHHAQSVQDDIKEGTRLGVTVTPTVFINGRIIRGALSLERFKNLIEAEVRHQSADRPLKSSLHESTPNQ